MFVTRQNQKEIFKSFISDKVSALLGPRRVGKSTLVQYYVSQNSQKKWVEFNMDVRAERLRVETDELQLMIEERALQKISSERTVSVVIDEAQKCPALFEQIKIIYDRFKGRDAIKFILTGSGALSLHQMASESLAGRIELHQLREFGLHETVTLMNQQESPPSVRAFASSLSEINFTELKKYAEELMPWRAVFNEALTTQLLWGGLPEVLPSQEKNDRLLYLSNYLQTYLEKDVRDIASISNLNLYQKLMEVVAEQTGSIREDKNILQALGCSRDALKKYRGFLEATLVYREVYPFLGSSLRRLVKSPKGYLNNNGLISYLTGVHEIKILQSTGTIGHRFENWLLKELQITLDRNCEKSEIFFWRTSAGMEVDFVVKQGQHVIPIEVTFAAQPDSKKVKNLASFLADEKHAHFGLYIYNGALHQDKEKRIIFLPAWLVGS